MTNGCIPHLTVGLNALKTDVGLEDAAGKIRELERESRTEARSDHKMTGREYKMDSPKPLGEIMA